jgi:hypothetical protein
VVIARKWRCRKRGLETRSSICIKAIDPQVSASTVARRRRPQPARKSRGTKPWVTQQNSAGQLGR